MGCIEYSAYELLAYAFLLCAMLSAWVIPSRWVWGSLGIVSLCFALYQRIASPALVLMLFFALFFLQALTWNINKITRFFAVILFACITFFVYFHMTPGIHNILLVQRDVINQGCQPYSMYWNYDKGLFALLLVGLYHPLIRTWPRLAEVAKQTWPFLVVTPLILMMGALFLGMVRIDTQVPSFVIVWIFTQIFFVTLPEEAFYRGFLQKELSEALPQKFGDTIAIIVVAGVFSLAHLFFTTDVRFLLLSFAAGVLYGATYARTKSIEASFFVHLAVNLLHMFAFSYPYLK